MGWLSIFKPRAEGAAPAPAAPTSTDSVARARTRARQRLVGAIVLVVIGVIGFPLVFETRPRPIPVDVAIEIPRKENAAPLKVPAPVAPRPAASSPREEIVTESAADAGRDVPAPASTLKPSVAASAAVRVPPALATPPPAVAVTPAPAPVKPPPLADQPKAAGADGARAQSLLEGNGAAAKVGGRFVVQVGAFAEASAASEIRGKVERLGLKTYTQIAETPAGKRIRVRLGPYASRDEADRALGKARAAGLAGNVLAL